MKSKLPQILMALAGLMLLVLFLAPMWRISLIAPQYPNGVHMWIYIDHLGGSEPGTLQNINILNHYIGMKYIVPESIPELKYFPIAAVIFTVSALLVAFLNKKILYMTWLVVFGVSLVLAMYDFYLWEYDYGHSLDPNAIMKFEGESFQPPLFGSKKVITFTAKSYPMIGGYFIMLSALLAAIATYLRYKAGKAKPGIMNMVAFVFGLSMLMGCDASPVEIAYGEEQCASCRMIISDARFGAELVTTKGKVHKYDAIECMAEEVLLKDESAYAHILVTNFETPGILFDARKAKYIVSRDRPSPMGAFLSAYDMSASSVASTSNDTRLLDWDSVLSYVKKGDFQK